MGFSELFVLGGIALLVIGPKQLPEVARNLARLINELKRTAFDMRKNFDGVDEDLKNVVQEVTSATKNTEDWVKKKAQDMVQPEESNEVENTKNKKEDS